ncbi:unnamed protein product, partial [Oncorhynchus mykiss]
FFFFSCSSPESNEFILYAVRNSIHRYDLATGTDQVLPLSGLREAVALDFDYERNCLYWADISLDTIQRLCLNGSTGQEVIVRKDLQNVEALTFDPISRLLYWVDAGAQRIEGWGATGEPGPANQKELFPTKVLYYRQKYSSVSSAVWVAGLRGSCS